MEKSPELSGTAFSHQAHPLLVIATVLPPDSRPPEGATPSPPAPSWWDADLFFRQKTRLEKKAARLPEGPALSAEEQMFPRRPGREALRECSMIGKSGGGMAILPEHVWSLHPRTMASWG